MAYQSIWYYTNIPNKIIDIIEEDLKDNFDNQLHDSRVGEGDYGTVDRDKRNARNAWVPTSHWISGFVWHYVQRANRENFCYDLTSIDGESVQYTQYGPGQFYDWHIDAGIDSSYKPQFIVGSGTNLAQDNLTLDGEYIRKLSFSLQLSDINDYTGGEVQFLDNSRRTYFAPKKRGTLILFDSRTPHRVRKVKSGLRKSLVGWVVGPRWK